MPHPFNLRHAGPKLPALYGGWFDASIVNDMSGALKAALKDVSGSVGWRPATHSVLVTIDLTDFHLYASWAFAHTCRASGGLRSSVRPSRTSKRCGDLFFDPPGVVVRAFFICANQVPSIPLTTNRLISARRSISATTRRSRRGSRHPKTWRAKRSWYVCMQRRRGAGSRRRDIQIDASIAPAPHPNLGLCERGLGEPPRTKAGEAHAARGF